MARNFLAFPFAPYNGVYSSKPFDTGRGLPKGLMVAADIVWNTYQANGHVLGADHPNFVVIFDLNAAGPNSVSQMWNIQSVYIDNEGVDFPVYAYFQDTQFTVSCPANSAGWYQVFTNARRVYIAGIGIPDSDIVSGARTRLFFTDTPMVPSLDQEVASSLSLWLGSTTIQAGNLPLPGVGAPALGDQVTTGFMQIGQAVPLTPISNHPNNFLYITQYQLFFQSDGTGFIGAVFLTNDLDGEIDRLTLNTNDALTTGQIACLAKDLRGNFRVRGAANWVLNSQINSGTPSTLVSYSIVYTVNPN